MTLIRILKSHDGDDGVRRKGDVYDANSTIATAKIAAGVAEALDAGEITAYNATNFVSAAATAVSARATTATAVGTARTAHRTAKAAQTTARLADIAARADVKQTARAASIGDTAGPSGYGVNIVAASYQLGVDANAVAVNLTTAEVGATYALSITSSGGGTPVTRTGTIATATTNLTAIDCSGLTAGTLTASLVLTDSHGNAGAAVTDTATLVAAA
ncbi:MAG: hypothetical protein ACRCU1_06460 [Alsobacter sp.]